MNKIHVSIIGSCVSREIFNDPRMQEIFCIDTYVHIKSSGFEADNFSSIIFNNTEYSKNDRGLNFVILDLNEMNVIDTASCDLNNDSYLLINSQYLSNLSIK